MIAAKLVISNRQHPLITDQSNHHLFPAASVFLFFSKLISTESALTAARLRSTAYRGRIDSASSLVQRVKRPKIYPDIVVSSGVVNVTLYHPQRRDGLVECPRVVALAGLRRATVGRRGAAADAADDVRRARPTSKVQHSLADPEELPVRGLQ